MYALRVAMKANIQYPPLATTKTWRNPALLTSVFIFITNDVIPSHCLPAGYIKNGNLNDLESDMNSHCIICMLVKMRYMILSKKGVQKVKSLSIEYVGRYVARSLSSNGDAYYISLHPFMI